MLTTTETKKIVDQINSAFEKLEKRLSVVEQQLSKSTTKTTTKSTKTA